MAATSTTNDTQTHTPEKVKNLLSSFLASSEQTRTEAITRGNASVQGEKTFPSDGTAYDLRPRLACSTSVLRSYDSYLQRLDTFSSLTWFNKPAELNPLICARYGWENIDTDMLQCVGCKAFLCGQLPVKTNPEVYEESLSKLKKNLLAAHDKFCALAVNPCPESFCRVPLHDPTNLTAEYTERASKLSQIQERLPVIDYTRLHELEYDEGQGAAYCKKHLMPDSDVSPQAVTLAFTGWTTSSQNVLVCCMCRRQVGLWNYAQESSRGLAPDSTTKESSDEDEESKESGEPEAKKRKMKVSIKQKFDPIEEHWHWCPWVTETEVPCSSPPSGQQAAPAQRQKSLAFITAIKVTAPGLMDNNTGLAHAMKTSPMVEGLRCFRRVMKSWSSPKLLSAGNSPT
ncbi:nuclear-interacting partner of ALK isoform X2 [Aplysia californica]|uniref:Nuclear-interacting partner of ALK isoform X1 n=1 Tax=Aplysia californica TaxID=6500 RepID=A0ABM0JZ69_APLCA|nr:nuclear-interacting partner of ALK isoform X1 [Aplysia californica]XP_035827372.1 nuclear-interacting partner of ALK isoform X2 [Aplysia californica]